MKGIIYQLLAYNPRKMSDIDILVAMVAMSLEKVLQFAENVQPNYINSKSNK